MKDSKRMENCLQEDMQSIGKFGYDFGKHLFTGAWSDLKRQERLMNENIILRIHSTKIREK
jgi:hypothetical protein